MAVPNLIGFTGKAGAGKDLAAIYLSAFRLSTHQDAFLDSFAAPIYGAVSAILGLPVSELQNRDRKEAIQHPTTRTRRYLLQTLGTEWGRDIIHQDLWLRLAQDRYQKRLENGAGTIITDVRFKNEADWVQESGGVLVHVYRPGVPELAMIHRSETSLDYERADYFVCNDGTKTDLKNTIKTLGI